jgi:hypothetical protein
LSDEVQNFVFSCDLERKKKENEIDNNPHPTEKPTW